MPKKTIKSVESDLVALKAEVQEYLKSIRTRATKSAFSAVPYAEDGKPLNLKTPEIMAIVLTARQLGYEVKVTSTPTGKGFESLVFQFVEAIPEIPASLYSKLYSI